MDDAAVARLWREARGEISEPAKLAVAVIAVIAAWLAIALPGGLARQVAAAELWDLPPAVDTVFQVRLVLAVAVVGAVGLVSGLRGVSWWARAAIVVLLVDVALLAAA